MPRATTTPVSRSRSSRVTPFRRARPARGASRLATSPAYSAAFIYNQNGETAAAPLWIAQDIHEPDVASYPTPGTGYYRYPYFNSKYALSFWCADCHNLNLGGWEPLSDP